MVELILLLIANSLLCLGVWVATQWDGSDSFDELSDILQKRQKGLTIHSAISCDGNPFYDKEYRDSHITDKMILWWIRYYGSALPKFWQKPLYRCLPCMASIWSVPVLTTAVLMGMLEPVQALILAPTYILALAGLNYIISTKFT